MIRNARKEEYFKALTLINTAYGHVLHKLCNIPERGRLIEFLAGLYKAENNRLSYENIMVYEVDNEIAGLVSIYDGVDASRLDELFFRHCNCKLECESLEQFFYLNVLAVDEKYRKMGIARKLIKACMQKAGSKGINLIVDAGNKGAIKSYLRMGFKPYSHMIYENESYYRFVKL